jgi:hypothetical protein
MDAKSLGAREVPGITAPFLEMCLQQNGLEFLDKPLFLARKNR